MYDSIGCQSISTKSDILYLLAFIMAEVDGCYLHLFDSKEL